MTALDSLAIPIGYYVIGFALAAAILPVYLGTQRKFPRAGYLIDAAFKLAVAIAPLGLALTAIVVVPVLSPFKIFASLALTGCISGFMFIAMWPDLRSDLRRLLGRPLI